MRLVAGQKIALADAVKGSPITVEVDYGDPGVDVVLFGLSKDRRIEDDRYTVLHSQRTSPSREIQLTIDGQTASFEIDLDELPLSMDRVLIVASHDRLAMSDVKPLVVTVGDASFDAGSVLGDERAVKLMELYRYGTDWKLAAIGQGFVDGLPRLVEQLGGEVAGGRSVPQPASSVSLEKITLERSQSVNLEKLDGADGHGPIILNLTWGRRAGRDVDLDLGCMYELHNGEKGIIQALGKAFGSISRPPYIALDKDDRSGDSQTGETIRINGDKLAEISRLAVFALIYEGVVNWAQTDAVASIRVPGRPEIAVPIRQGNDRQRVFGMVVIDAHQGALRVVNHMTNYSNQKEFGDAVGIFLNWREGWKD